ncbi:transglycosylase SLT domain-containing protein [Thermatribacter velox]|uniref:Transglycosylase SLT domain-containing protein n=1 Tax=Thermatribacter velox TaxID=3039681 RepID=A0ABZ2YG13_9BACT
MESKKRTKTLSLYLSPRKTASIAFSLLILMVLFSFWKPSCEAENQENFLQIAALVERGKMDEAEIRILQSLGESELFCIDHALYLWLSALSDASFLQKAPLWLSLAEKLFPDSPLLFSIYHQSAERYLKNGYSQQALTYTIKALQHAFLAEQRQQSLALMVKTLAQKGKYNEAGLLLKTVFKQYSTQKYLPTRELFSQIFPELKLESFSVGSLLDLASFALSLNLFEETKSILQEVEKRSLNPLQKENLLSLQIRYLLTVNDLPQLQKLLEKYSKETYLQETLLFYQGVLSQRSANYPEAINHYQKLLQAYPHSPYLFSVYLNLLTCYQSLGDDTNYSLVLHKALELFPQRDTFYLVWFQKALRENNPEQIQAALEGLQKFPQHKNRALFWSYKLGKNSEPELLWEILKDENIDYYFVRSWQELIQKGYNPQEHFHIEDRPLPVIENYPQNLSTQLEKAREHWKSYLFLKEKGFYQNAEIELLFLYHKNPSAKLLHLEFVRLYISMGEYRKAILHTLYLQQNFSQTNHNLFLLRNLYPLFFKQEVEKATRLFPEVDPYLVFSVIRAESLFEVASQSRAGALGLAQLMPQTAQWMLETGKIKLKLETIDEETLLQPEINIHIGVAYLDYLLKQFEGKLIPTICSYNAGPGRVKQWLQSYSENPDLFFESIPFPETKGYLEKVLVNYLYYSLIWKGSFSIEKLF